MRVVIAGLLAELLLRREQSRLPLLPEPVALAPNVDHVAVMQQSVQDGRGADGVPQEFFPFAEALV